MVCSFKRCMAVFAVAAGLGTNPALAFNDSFQDPNMRALELLDIQTKNMVAVIQTRCGIARTADAQECLTRTVAPHRHDASAASAFAQCASDAIDAANIAFYNRLWLATLSPDHIHQALYTRAAAMDEVTKTCQSLYKGPRVEQQHTVPKEMMQNIG